MSPRKSRGAGPSRQVPIRFSEEELARIDDLAEKAGLTRSEYVRRQALQLEPPPLHIPEDLVTAIRVAARERKLSPDELATLWLWAPLNGIALQPGKKRKRT